LFIFSRTIVKCPWQSKKSKHLMVSMHSNSYALFNFCTSVILLLQFLISLRWCLCWGF
jgi:hypothetical protein